MRITQVTLNFTETCNLGDYSNTKPSVELTALLEAGDSILTVVDELVTIAKGVIHEKIDEEMERVDRPVKYFDGPTFDVIYSGYTRLIAIVPTSAVKQLPGGYSTAAERIRYDAAMRRAAYQVRMMSDARLFDCQAGDLTGLIAYATEQEQHKIAEREERDRRQEEERARQRAEWEAQRRAESANKQEEDDDEEDDDEEDDDEEVE